MCPYCFSSCISHGISSTGNKRYRCRSCKRTHSKLYALKACKPSISEKIKSLLKEGCGIRSISRLLKISVTTVMKRIRMIAENINKPPRWRTNPFVCLNNTILLLTNFTYIY